MKIPKIKRKVMFSWMISYLFILLCSLITGLNMDKYLSSIHGARNMTILFLVGFSVLGIVLSYFLVKHNYSPIQRLMGNINYKSFNNESAEVNELQCIEKSFNMLFQEKESLSQRLKRQKNVIFNSLLIQLLKGRDYSTEEIQDIMYTEAVAFKTDKFMVVKISIQDYGKLLIDDSEDIDINQAAELTYLVVKNILEEMLGKEHQAYVVEIDTMLACIININGDKEVGQNYVGETIEKAVDFIRNNYNMQIFASISNINSSLFGINKGYKEAQCLLEKLLLFDNGRYVAKCSDSVTFTRNVQSGYSRTELRYKLINNLMVGNFVNAEQLVDEIIELDLKDNAFMRELPLRRYSLIEDLYSAVEILIADSNSPHWQEVYNIISKLSNSKGVAKYRSLVQELFVLIHQISKEKEELLKSNDKTNDIIEYIDSNLTDPNLSVTMVSDHVCISVSQVTRLLRSKIGIGALEYIQNKRISAAKKYLEETDLNVNEISALVGYYNFRAMNYAFKKVEGITASQYRDQLKKVLAKQMKPETKLIQKQVFYDSAKIVHQDY